MANKFDRKGRRKRWAKALSAESGYSSKLRQIAKAVGHIVQGMAPNGLIKDPAALVKALVQYAQVIEPWAQSVAELMTADVFRRDRSMWRQNSKEMATAIAREVEKAPTGEILRGLQAEQVKLIKSLPLEAAQRVHDLSIAAITDSTRASTIAKQILETGHVTESRARLIARTEVSRASSNLLQARSQWAGSSGYIWRTSGDGDVRDSHAEMEGRYVRWDSPPTLDKMKGHAGCLPNCRCFAEPVFPDD